MALSVVDLYRDVLPQTNCGECGASTCLAFASKVVSEKHDLGGCPHVDADQLAKCKPELDQQYREGRWTKRDNAADALAWARQKATSMRIGDLPDRIGGCLITRAGATCLELPYFNATLIIDDASVSRKDGLELTRYEQVFIYNHMAQGGRRQPGEKWKGLVEFPNTVSKIKSMVEQVETPLIQRFRGKTAELKAAAAAIGGEDRTDQREASGLNFYFQPLPRVPVTLMFWDEDPEEGFDPMAKLLFDETVTDHLDIESIMFLSERLRQLLCDFDAARGLPESDSP
ncbi:MAG: DUF3786 domain-containing protein [Desulfobacterales bacterium]|nr:DUF3786 domain-containing protein [Desulfobacterales bacterium]